MQITSATLDEVDVRYSEVLQLTPHANDLMASLDRAEQLRSEYVSAGFVTIENVLPPETFTALVTSLLPILSAVAEEVAMRHMPSPDRTLSDGFRFSRIDPYCARHPAAVEKLQQLLKSLGLVDFASLLASQVTPLIRYIAGPVSFRRFYFYIYKEGDYISVHDDHHVGNRVDVQFPIALGTIAGLRVLADGHLRLRYDKAGSMNVLGPRIWHDVPPILRIFSGIDPMRFNMGFRFTCNE